MKPLLFAAVLSLLPAVASAHCDTLDGPVVVDARAALESGKLNPVLAWVRPADEAEVRASFERARKVRKLGADARELADTAFLETLVRLHRAGEGAPYTGLKPAGQDLGPAVTAADELLRTHQPAELEAVLVNAVREGLRRHLHRLHAQKRPGEDVAAGRAWVAAYVPYVHWVEGVYDAAVKDPAHGAEAGHEAPKHDH